MRRPTSSRVAAALAIVALFVLRHDLWWWSDSRLVLGLPIGLASQVLVCLLAIPVFAFAAGAFGVEDEE